MRLTGPTVLRRESEELLTTRVDGELVALSVGKGTCYGFDAVGTRIWDLLEQPRSVDSLCDELVREYDVDAARCRSEALAFLEQLRAEGMVKVAGAR